MSVIREDNTCLIYFDDEEYKTGVKNIFEVVDGTTPFFISSDFTYVDKTTLRSGKITHNGTSETTFNLIFNEAGSINLNCGISSEKNYDKLHVLLDGTEKILISGTVDFTDYSFDVDEGQHTLIFRYTKDGSGNTGKDACAIGYINLIGVVAPYIKKYLMADFNDNVYTIVDEKVKQVSTLTRSDLKTKDVFEEYGFDDLPSSEELTSLTKPVLFRWCEGEVNRLSVDISAIPNSQTIKAIADMSHATIKGISSITCVYSGDVFISYSYDDKSYSDSISMEEFLSIDVDELYNNATNKKIYFKLVIEDENSSLTNFVITYKNE